MPSDVIGPIIAHLERFAPQRLSSSQIAESIGLDATQVTGSLKNYMRKFPEHVLSEKSANRRRFYILSGGIEGSEGVQEKLYVYIGRTDDGFPIAKSMEGTVYRLTPL